MEVVLYDVAGTLGSLLVSTIAPKERFAIAQQTILDPSGLLGQLAPLGQVRACPFYQVMEAVMRDGFDLMAAQQMFGLFSPARRVEASVWTLERLDVTDVYGRACAALEAAAALVDPAILPARTTLLIIPGDPSNRNFMVRNSGLSVFGGAAGHVAAEIWPSDGNLERLAPAIVRSWTLGLRWNITGAAERYTLGDALAAEGLAAAVAAALFPGDPAPWMVAHRAPAVWTDDLRHIAALYGKDTYDEVPANIYGSSGSIFEPPPPPDVLDDDELLYAEAIIREALEVDDPRTIAAYLYGDQIAAEQGHPQAGLPAYGGLEVAYRAAVRSGRSPMSALGLDTREIVAL